jgi:hypothetical protein
MPAKASSQSLKRLWIPVMLIGRRGAPLPRGEGRGEGGAPCRRKTLIRPAPLATFSREEKGRRPHPALRATFSRGEKAKSGRR